MLNDLVATFSKADNIEKIVLDNYIPKNGLYIKIKKDGTWESLLIEKGKIPQTELYKWFKVVDYYSNLLDMNKPVDTKKKVHSNNYLSFFMKCEILPEVGKSKEKALTQEELTQAIDNYYQALLQEKEDKKVQEIKDIIGFPKLEIETIKSCKEKIEKTIIEVIQYIKEQGVSSKDYVKLFLEEDIEIYRRESNRYTLPRIFNKNDFNLKIGEEIWGLSNDNVSLNAKKPYLECKTTKFRVPYRLSITQALDSKRFFDWLDSLQNENEKTLNKMYIPVHFKFENTKLGRERLQEDTCFYLYKTMQNGKSQIEDFAIVNQKKFKTIPIQNYLQIENYEQPTITSKEQLEKLIDEHFYRNNLIKSYYYDISANNGVFSAREVSLLMMSKQAMQDYFHKEINVGFLSCFDKITTELLTEKWIGKKSIYVRGIAEALNLKLNLLKHYQIGGKEEMGQNLKEMYENIAQKASSKEIEEIKNNEEFYFAAGQLAYYLISQSESAKKTLELATPFMQAGNAKRLKYILTEWGNKYHYKIQANFIKYKNLMAMVQSYPEESKLSNYREYLMAGICAKNMLFEKKEEE